MMSDSNKKAKKASSLSSEKDEISILKQYVARCPESLVPSSSNAIRVTLTALDEELKRLERDEKLRRKFSGASMNANTNANANANANANTTVYNTNSLELSDEDMVKVSAICDDEGSMRTQPKKYGIDEKEEESCLKEWQEIDGSETSSQPTSMDTSGSNRNGNGNGHGNTTAAATGSTVAGYDTSNTMFGANLAQIAIADMNNAKITVSTPTATLALVLHSALRSNILGFKCTGIPDEHSCFKSDVEGTGNGSKKAKLNGFAAPVRELSRGVFVPNKWDKLASKNSSSGTHLVLMRYIKNGMPASILRVAQDPDGMNDNGSILDSGSGSSETMVKVQFGPAGGEPTELKFPMGQHINLDGLNAASSVDSLGMGVKPALHFKALAGLVAEFCQTNDLGAVKDDNDTSGADMAIAMQHAVAIPPPSVSREKLGFVMERTRHPPNVNDDLLAVNSNRRHFPGDFSDDLLPSGLPAPDFANPRLGTGMTGNLMGPNHPNFYRNFDEDDYTGMNNGVGFPAPGGLGMQPRFDPFYPPAVSGRGMRGRGPQRGRGRGRGGRFSSGDPNPDHQRPPSNFDVM